MKKAILLGAADQPPSELSLDFNKIQEALNSEVPKDNRKNRKSENGE